MKKATIVLADDQPMFRLGLRRAINIESQFEIIGEADDGVSALELIAWLKPQIAVMDWRIPRLSGPEIVRRLNAHKLETRTVMLSRHVEKDPFNEAFDAGVNGYVLKGSRTSELLQCLESVLAGDLYLSPQLWQMLAIRVRNTTRLREEKPGLEELTVMQRAVLRRISNRKPSSTIATELGVSRSTIDLHRRNLMRKLELEGRYALVQFALRHKYEF